MNFSEQSKRKAVTFSYDDGVTQDIMLIQMLNKYGLKGTFNISSGLFGKNDIYRNEAGTPIAAYKLHREDVKFVYEGHELAVHTLTHPNLTMRDNAEVIRQVEQDRLNLSEIVGYEVVGMAYPCGGVNNNDHVAELIKNNTGVKYSRTITDNFSFEPQTNLYRFNPTIHHIRQFDKLMELAEQFVAMEADTPQIFYIWGHSFEMDYIEDGWHKMEEFCKFISNRSDIFYGTNAEVLL